MAQEHERKFLVTNNKWKRAQIVDRINIQQGYLHKSRDINVRIRIANDLGFVTIKGKKVDITCPEFEYEIPLQDAKQLIKLSSTPLIKKTRFYVQDQFSQVWHVDVFRGINRGLVVAEIELSSANADVVRPEWIGHEVTHDRRYANAYLAEHPAPSR